MESQVSPVHLIIVAPPEIQKTISARLTQVSMTCEACDNVYLATALVFRNIKRITRRQLVIVWLDNLASRQFDFFELLTRSEAGLSVAISGNDENKLAHALEKHAHHAVLMADFNVRLVNEILASEIDSTLPTQTPPAYNNLQNKDITDTTDRSIEKNISVLLENDISLSAEEIDSLLSDDTE